MLSQLRLLLLQLAVIIMHGSTKDLVHEEMHAVSLMMTPRKARARVKGHPQLPPKEGEDPVVKGKIEGKTKEGHVQDPLLPLLAINEQGTLVNLTPMDLRVAQFVRLLEVNLLQARRIAHHVGHTLQETVQRERIALSGILPSVVSSCKTNVKQEISAHSSIQVQTDPQLQRAETLRVVLKEVEGELPHQITNLMPKHKPR